MDNTDSFPEEEFKMCLAEWLTNQNSVFETL